MSDIEPMLSVYRSHDRELLFYGNIEAGKARGVRIKRDLSSLVLDGERYKIVNRGFEPMGSGSIQLWIAA